MFLVSSLFYSKFNRFMLIVSCWVGLYTEGAFGCGCCQLVYTLYIPGIIFLNFKYHCFPTISPANKERSALLLCVYAHARKIKLLLHSFL